MSAVFAKQPVKDMNTTLDLMNDTNKQCVVSGE